MSDDELNDIIASWRIDMVRRERLETAIMVALTIAAALLLGVVIGAWVW
jgi:hypothetical protein